VEEAIVEIAGIEGANAITERLEIREVGGELWRCGLRFTGRGNAWCKGGSRNGGGGMEKMATGDGSHVGKDGAEGELCQGGEWEKRRLTQRPQRTQSSQRRGEKYKSERV